MVKVKMVKSFKLGEFSNRNVKFVKIKVIFIWFMNKRILGLEYIVCVQNENEIFKSGKLWSNIS